MCRNNSKPEELLVDFCDYKAVKFATANWHYSKSLPFSGNMVKIGIWEDGQFVGAVLFSWGANKNIGKSYALNQTEVCELVRVALRTHQNPVTRILARAIRLLKLHNPGLRLIVSYADPDQDHVGIIYQAGNWIYEGISGSTSLYFVNGRWMHRRTASKALGSLKGLTGKKTANKHKYLYPLDKKMRRQILPLSKPYPKRADVV